MIVEPTVVYERPDTLDQVLVVGIGHATAPSEPGRRVRQARPGSADAAGERVDGSATSRILGACPAPPGAFGWRAAV